MDFRVNITVEVDQIGNALAIQTPVPVQLVYHKSKWRARCEKPAVVSDEFDTMEAALTAGASQVAAELQAAVDHRPVVLARITPDQVPLGPF